MAVDVNAYAKELIDAAGLTDEGQRKAFEQFLGNEKVRAKLEPTIREATEGIERERGRTAAEKAKADKAEADKQAYYREQLRIANANKVVVDRANADVARYVAVYGELPGGGDPADPAAHVAAVQNVIDKKTFDERLAATENNTVGLLTTAMKLMDQHRREFPTEPFDVDGLVKIATEKKLTAAQAYSEMMAGKRDELSKARFEAEKKAAVDAALIEDRSKRAASQTVDPGSRSEFMTNAIKSKGEPLTKQESFLKGWREPNPSAAMEAEFGRKH